MIISNDRLMKGLRAVVPVLVLFVLAGYAQQGNVNSKSDTAVTLAYQFPEGKTLAYRQSSTETQNLEISGQPVTSQTQGTLEFSAKPKGVKDGNFNLGVTIDAMKVSVQGSQGDLSPDLSPVIGKSFDMVLSRLGKEIDTSGAAALHYDLGTGGSRDMAPSFQAFFLDLPDHPVKASDTWPSEDTVIQKVGSGEIRISVKHVHTLDGFETVDGRECARIKTGTKGTLTGNMEQGGVGLSFDGKIEGETTWYFAVKEGILVKADAKGSMGGVIQAGEPANMSIPITGESREEVRLIQK